MKEQDGFSATNEIKGWTLKNKIKERKKKKKIINLTSKFPYQNKGKVRFFWYECCLFKIQAFF